MAAAASIEQFLQHHRLPADYAATIEQWWKPLADEFATLAEGTALIGIHGAQGSGKSTLADALQMLLHAEHGLQAAVLSLDDFYLTGAQRQRLAAEIHPLFASRGVPGTHDLPLALQTLRRLREARAGEQVRLPRFDKSADERVPEAQWPVVTAPVPIILLEGWCLAAPPQPEAELAQPVNALEEDEDPDGRWRRHVNRALARDYPPLFGQLQRLVMLRAPSFAAVGRWRQLQERKLREATGRGMSPVEVERFVQHFERLTRHALRVLPERADICFDIDEDHRIVQRRDH